MNAIAKAFKAGKDFAAEINSTPREAQNWSKLDTNDDLPDGDYVTLRDEFGEVTVEMEQSYKKGFNEVFSPIG
jgi:formylmethanofuran dehydrogenase subunit D